MRPGQLAAVVTYLEMRRPPQPLPVGANSGLAIERLHQPDLERYRRLFRAVGEDSLWSSRLRLDDAALAAAIRHPAVNVSALRLAGGDKGLLEIDFRPAPDAELVFLGVTRDLIGQGAGRFLLAHALAHAWARPIERLLVHTCTLDHPRAIEFYLKAGFIAYQQAIEITPDPRLTGLLPTTAAPHIPLIA